MELTIPAEYLSEACKTCVAAIPAKPAQPHEALLLLSHSPEAGILQVAAAGPAMQVTISVPVNASVASEPKSPQAIACTGRPMAELADKLNSEVTIATEQRGPGRPEAGAFGKIKISSEGATAKFYTVDPDDFQHRPEGPKPDRTNTAIVDAADFRRAVARILPTIGSDNQAEAGEPSSIAAVQLAITPDGHDLHLLTTDGYRISSHLTPLEAPTGARWEVVVAPQVVRLAARLAGANPGQLQITDSDEPKQVAFRYEKAELVASKLWQPFPNIDGAMPTKFRFTALVWPAYLKKMIDPALAFSHSDAAKAVLTHVPAGVPPPLDQDEPTAAQLELNDQDRLCITMDTSDLGTFYNQVPLSNSDGMPGQTIAIQYKYLKDLAAVNWVGEIAMQAGSDRNGILFRDSQNPAFYQLIAPMVHEPPPPEGLAPQLL